MIALASNRGCCRANVPASSESSRSGSVSAESHESDAGTASCTISTTRSPVASAMPRLRVRPWSNCSAGMRMNRSTRRCSSSAVPSVEDESTRRPRRGHPPAGVQWRRETAGSDAAPFFVGRTIEIVGPLTPRSGGMPPLKQVARTWRFPLAGVLCNRLDPAHAGAVGQRLRADSCSRQGMQR